MSFPEQCIRGIDKKDKLIDDSKPVSRENINGALFQFSQKNRPDKLLELSINWNDDSRALKYTLKQKKDGRIQFAIGAAFLDRNKIDKYNKEIPQLNNLISYERDANPELKYHGNILCPDTINRPVRRMMASALAFCVVDVVENKYV